MIKYKKVYLKYFKFSEGDFIPCEVCGAASVDIHHIVPKSLEKRLENSITNLVALCRKHHDLCHSDRKFNAEVGVLHRKHCLKHSNQDDRIIY